MLIEAWERLHGYNKWTPAVAKVQTSRLVGVGFRDGGQGTGRVKQEIAWQSVCKIVWRDQDQVPRTAEFEVFEESPLYQLCDGDTVDIRFNPMKPDEFYLPGLIQSKLAKTWKLTIYAMLVILVLIGIGFAWFGPNILNAVSH